MNPTAEATATQGGTQEVLKTPVSKTMTPEFFPFVDPLLVCSPGVLGSPGLPHDQATGHPAIEDPAELDFPEPDDDFLQDLVAPGGGEAGGNFDDMPALEVKMASASGRQAGTNDDTDDSDSDEDGEDDVPDGEQDGEGDRRQGDMQAGRQDGGGEQGPGKNRKRSRPLKIDNRVRRGIADDDGNDDTGAVVTIPLSFTCLPPTAFLLRLPGPGPLSIFCAFQHTLPAATCLIP